MAVMGVSARSSDAGVEPGDGHAFAQAAFFQEILLQPPELLVEPVGGHLDEAGNDHVSEARADSRRQ